MTLQNEPFSLESDNENVEPSNNLMIFINGVFQELMLHTLLMDQL